jgi:hypothetical protein
MIVIRANHEKVLCYDTRYNLKKVFGLIKNICTEHGYDLFRRNYFETSHAKGPQDAAGGFLKNQVD